MESPKKDSLLKDLFFNDTNNHRHDKDYCLISRHAGEENQAQGNLENMKFFKLKTQVNDKIVAGTWSQEGIFIELTLADLYCRTQLHFHVALFQFIRAMFRITLVISCLNF